MPDLLIKAQGKPETRHPLTGEVVSIGRGSSNTIQTRDAEASRQHCRIEPSASGYRLVDNRSRNGTNLNSKRVDSAELRAGDSISIGKFTIIFDPDGELKVDEDFVGTIEADAVSHEDANTSRPPEYIIEIVSGPQSGKCTKIESDTFSIGRASANTLALNDESASSYHAEITREPTGFFLTDLGSTNGTKINGEKIVKSHLSAGAKIEIGSVELSFKNIGGKSEEDEIFGTVVLDPDKLHKELAEDALNDRKKNVKLAAIAIVGTIILALGIVAIRTALKSSSSSGPVGNKIANSSFSGGTTDTGAPTDWRFISRSPHTPWSVEITEDRKSDNSDKAMLVVRREAAARIDEMTECAITTPLSVSLGKAYVLGGHLRTLNAQGFYGFRVKWMRSGVSEQSAMEYVYLMGSHAKWRKKSGVVSPPSWADTAEIACFAIGNRGVIQFDDVFFYESDKKMMSLVKSFGGVSAEFSGQGMFSLNTDSIPAILSGGMFFETKSNASFSQTLASDSISATEGDTYTFSGVIHEITNYEQLTYRQSCSSATLGLRMSYELSTMRSMGLKITGLRLKLSEEFSAGTMELFDSSEPIRNTPNAISRAKEIMFSTPDGKLAIAIKGNVSFRVETVGRSTFVDVVLPKNYRLGKNVTSFDVEFSTTSNVSRNKLDAALAAYNSAVAADSYGDMYSALNSIIKLDTRFPDDAADAVSKMQLLDDELKTALKEIDSDCKKISRSNTSDALFETYRERISVRLERIKTQYANTPRVNLIEDAEEVLANIVDERSSKQKEKKAAALLDNVLRFVASKNFTIAEQVWNQFEARYADTDAYQRALARQIPSTITDGIALIQFQRQQAEKADAAYIRLTSKIRNYLLNKQWSLALKLLKADAGYKQFKTFDKFKKLHDELVVKVAGSE